MTERAHTYYAIGIRHLDSSAAITVLSVHIAVSSSIMVVVRVVALSFVVVSLSSYTQSEDRRSLASTDLAKTKAAAAAMATHQPTTHHTYFSGVASSRRRRSVQGWPKKAPTSAACSWFRAQ